MGKVVETEEQKKEAEQKKHRMKHEKELQKDKCKLQQKYKENLNQDKLKLTEIKQDHKQIYILKLKHENSKEEQKKFNQEEKCKQRKFVSKLGNLQQKDLYEENLNQEKSNLMQK